MPQQVKLWNKEFDLMQTHSELEDFFPISYAAKYGDVEYIVSKLSKLDDKEKNRLLQLSSSQGLTPLHYACVYGQVETAKALITCGASLYKATSLGLLPIHLIFGDRNDLNKCQVLFDLFLNRKDWIAKRTSSNETIAHFSAVKGAVEILKVIQSIAPELLNAKNNQSVTPLLAAVLNNQIEAAKYLLANSDIHLSNSKGQNALHTAVLASSVETMLAVLPYFDIHTTDNEKNSALDLARKYGHGDKEEVLNSHSVSVSP